MEVKYLKEGKDEAEIELNNLTITELLRVYLADDGDVSFVAWRRAHPTKNPVLKIKTKGKPVKKAVQDAVARIEKELDKLEGEFKKAK